MGEKIYHILGKLPRLPLLRRHKPVMFLTILPQLLLYPMTQEAIELARLETAAVSTLSCTCMYTCNTLVHQTIYSLLVHHVVPRACLQWG